MNLEQLTGRYLRLKEELAISYETQPWRGGHIDRVADELASIERQLSIAHAKSGLLTNPFARHGSAAVGRHAHVGTIDARRP